MASVLPVATRHTKRLWPSLFRRIAGLRVPPAALYWLHCCSAQADLLRPAQLPSPYLVLQPEPLRRSAPVIGVFSQDVSIIISI